MRTFNSSSAAASLMLVDDGINSSNTLEFRATLAPAGATNKAGNASSVQFVYHGGRITLGKHGLFGEFRPMPYQYESKDGVRTIKTNADGTAVTSRTWCQHVTKSSFNLTAQEQSIIALIQSKPENAALLSGMLSLNAQKALSEGGLQYEEFDWETFLEASDLIQNTKFTFSIPSRFDSVIEQIKDVISSKEKGENYSLVIRFDANHLIGNKDLAKEYNSEEDRKDVGIIITYIGIIGGVTKTDTNLSKVINPIIVTSALDKAKAAAKNKEANPYLDQSFLAEQAKRVRERLNSLGRGKKAHQPIVASIYEAAAVGNTVKLEEDLALLKAVEIRGENPAVNIGYTANIERKIGVTVTETPVTPVIVVENEREEMKAMITMEDYDENGDYEESVAAPLDNDALANLFD